MLRERARAARADIQAGTLRGAALLMLLLSVPFRERDAWVDELLALEPAPLDDSQLPRGAVPYLPSGVEEILATMQEAPLRSQDQFVDLGSGLGKVVILVHLLSGASALGVELQEPLVRSATACATQLALPAVSFVHESATDIELDGSVFFLYAPCNGEMLTRVLARLEQVARRRRIVVCAVQLEFGEVPWLVARKSSSVSLVFYDSICAEDVQPE